MENIEDYLESENVINTVRIGRYLIQDQIGYGVYIERSSGEGMQVSTEKFEKALDDFFDKEF